MLTLGRSSASLRCARRGNLMWQMGKFSSRRSKLDHYDMAIKPMLICANE
jgi:hypothetical protein